MLRLQNTRRGLETLVRVGKMVDTRMVDGLDIIDVVKLLLEHREQDGYMHRTAPLSRPSQDKTINKEEDHCMSCALHTVTVSC